MVRSLRGEHAQHPECTDLCSICKVKECAGDSTDVDECQPGSARRPSEYSCLFTYMSVALRQHPASPLEMPSAPSLAVQFVQSLRWAESVLCSSAGRVVLTGISNQRWVHMHAFMRLARSPIRPASSILWTCAILAIDGRIAVA